MGDRTKMKFVNQPSAFAFRTAFVSMALASTFAFAAQTTERVSVGNQGEEGDYQSPQAVVSGNGRYVVFTSRSDNLVILPIQTTPDNSFAQVFVRDLQNNTTTCVSTDAFGFAANAGCFNPRITSDGQYVTFSSEATNLAPNDTNGSRDVFRRYMGPGGGTICVSIGVDGFTGNGVSDSSAVSDDGNFVAFRSIATNLVPGGTYASQVFLRDISLGATEVVSVSGVGVIGDNDSGSFQQSMSPDGRYVGFASKATNLVQFDTNNTWDAFVRDRQLGTTTRVSVATNGLQGYGWSHTCMVSDNGRYAAFVSPNGFVNGDSNGTWDVFVKDLQTNAIVRASVDSAGKQANGASGNSEGWGMRLGGDGTKVVFESAATNLVKGDNNGKLDIFVRDLVRNKTTLVTFDRTGRASDGDSMSPTISRDGSYIAFISAATDLISGDTNGVLDAFRRGPY